MPIRSTPTSITHAYRIINGTAPGDYGEAQKFLKSMSEGERHSRLRSEKQGEVNLKKRKRPMGTKPYPYNSRQYK